MKWIYCLATTNRTAFSCWSADTTIFSRSQSGKLLLWMTVECESETIWSRIKTQRCFLTTQISTMIYQIETNIDPTTPSNEDKNVINLSFSSSSSIEQMPITKIFELTGKKNTERKLKLLWNTVIQEAKRTFC